MEVWKDIPGYEGLYQVSSHGRVKSLERTRANGIRWKEKILPGKVTRTGRLEVGLCRNGCRKYYLIHRLVLATFNPVENMDKLQVNHKDENPLNNMLGNLAWMTCKENINYGTRTERAAKGHLKPIYCVELDSAFDSLTSASRATGAHIENISHALHGRREVAGGYHWRYEE